MEEEETFEYNYSRSDTKRDIMLAGAGLGLPSGWLEQVAEIVTKAVDRWIEDKATVTEDDIRRHIISELEPLNPDMAYAFENYDKII